MYQYYRKAVQAVTGLTLVSALTITMALPGFAQTGQTDTTAQTFQQANIGGINQEVRGAFALLATAERTVDTVLNMIEPDFTAAGITQQDSGMFIGSGNELADFRILQPATRIALQTSWEILGSVADGLDTYELLLESDLAEELVFNQGVLAGQEFEDDSGVIETQEPTDTEAADDTDTEATDETATGEATGEIVGAEGNFPGLDIDIELADGQCGDIDALVRVARRDIARALGFRPAFGEGELSAQQGIDQAATGAQQFVDPDLRIFAVNALRAHHQQMQQSLSCLAQFVPQG